MRNVTSLIVTVLLSALGTGCAFGQSAFEGMWIADAGTVQFSGNPTTFVIRNGEYQCTSCVPAITVQADDNVHPVLGNAYFDSVQITTVDDHTIRRVAMRSGAVVARSTITASQDGSTAIFEFMDARASSSNPIAGSGTLTRIGKEKHRNGLHALSGSWKIQRYTSLTGNALSMRLHVDGQRLAVRASTGQFYEAPLDGSDVTYHGDNAVTSVGVVQLGTYTLLETQKRDGKSIRTRRLMIDSDNHTSMHVIDTDIPSGETIVYEARVQQAEN